MAEKITPILVNYPVQLVERLDSIVESGMYASRSDALRDAARMLVRGSSMGFGAFRDFEPWRGKSAVEIMREMRAAMDRELLKKAGGDEKKAHELFVKELKKMKPL